MNNANEIEAEIRRNLRNYDGLTPGKFESCAALSAACVPGRGLGSKTDVTPYQIFSTELRAFGQDGEAKALRNALAFDVDYNYGSVDRRRGMYIEINKLEVTAQTVTDWENRAIRRLALFLADPSSRRRISHLSVRTTVEITNRRIVSWTDETTTAFESGRQIIEIEPPDFISPDMADRDILFAPAPYVSPASSSDLQVTLKFNDADPPTKVQFMVGGSAIELAQAPWQSQPVEPGTPNTFVVKASFVGSESLMPTHTRHLVVRWAF